MLLWMPREIDVFYQDIMLKSKHLLDTFLHHLLPGVLFGIQLLFHTLGKQIHPLVPLALLGHLLPFHGQHRHAHPAQLATTRMQQAKLSARFAMQGHTHWDHPQLAHNVSVQHFRQVLDSARVQAVQLIMQQYQDILVGYTC